ncbi:hypothetical protein THARTR1_05880 [Trichoderma harzianum]|uniref:Short-chain dehydrogenase n=1 Tax=Trichoderma harzianum TaxID=5544 RepID=A0A2K0U7K4_TRIHA|nr:hypothetical protein THARTR1_05880 [Trichoderma harzianum]
MGQPPIPPTPSEANVSGKTVIITGGNAGLGYDAARQYLTLGASRVILACRSIARGQEAVSSLRADPTVKTSNPDALIEVFELDLDDYQSGLRFAKKVKDEVKELDILLNNGGQIKQNTLSKKPIAPESSVLGHFDDEATFSKFFRYADTKTVINAYARRLAALAPSEVIVNNPCPGLVQTGLDKNLPFYLRIPMGLVRKSMARTVEEGARTLIFASVVAGPETNGKFLQHNKVDPGAAFLNTPEGEEFIGKLWSESVQDVAALDPALSAYA